MNHPNTHHIHTWSPPSTTAGCLTIRLCGWSRPSAPTSSKGKKHNHLVVLVLLVLDVNGVVVEGGRIQVAARLQGGAGTPSGWVFQAGVLGCAGGDTW